MHAPITPKWGGFGLSIPQTASAVPQKGFFDVGSFRSSAASFLRIRREGQRCGAGSKPSRGSVDDSGLARPFCADPGPVPAVDRLRALHPQPTGRLGRHGGRAFCSERRLSAHRAALPGAPGARGDDADDDERPREDRLSGRPIQDRRDPEHVRHGDGGDPRPDAGGLPVPRGARGAAHLRPIVGAGLARLGRETRKRIGGIARAVPRTAICRRRRRVS